MAEEPEFKKPDDLLVHSLSVEPTKRNLFLFLAIALAIGSISALNPMAAAIATGVLLVVLLSFLFTYESFLIFSLLLLSLGEYFGSKPIAIGSFKLYGADYLWVILTIALVKISRSERPKIKSPLTLFLWVYVVYGLVSLLIGLFYQHYEINRSLGDFRRFFLYALAFFLGWDILSEKEDIHRLGKIIQVAPPVIIAFATLRIWTGRTWAPDVHVRPEDFRSMSYFDGIALLFVFSFLLASFLMKRRLNLFQLLIVFAAPIYIVSSGFRLLWILFILTVSLVLWFTFRWKGHGRYRHIALIFVLVLLSLGVFRMFGGRYYDMFEKKFVDRIIQYDPSSERWRNPGWKGAIEEFQASPIVGTGLGQEPTFWALNSKGQRIKLTRTLHNAFLEIVYKTGIIGAFLFLMIIFKYFLSVPKNLKKADSGSRPITLALFIFFICGLCMSLFQPYLNDPGNCVLFFSFMGISMKMAHFVKMEAEKSGRR